MEFSISVAGLEFRIAALYPFVREYCRTFLCDPTVNGIPIMISKADIDLERKRSEYSQAEEDMPVFCCLDDYVETLAIYRRIAEIIPSYDTFLFHGSALALDGEGYLFAAVSGTGKSTHARLWRERFGDRVVMVNDDKPLIRVMDDEVLVCGTPWNGKHRLSSPICVPLRGLCLLERDTENHIEPITRREAFPTLVQQTYRPLDPAQLAKTMALIDRMAGMVKLYRLGCNMDPEAAEVAYNGMNGDNQ